MDLVDLRRPSPPQACSRKLTPLRQWFYFDALECLPEEEDQDVTLPEADFSAVCGDNMRYPVVAQTYPVMSVRELLN